MRTFFHREMIMTRPIAAAERMIAMQRIPAVLATRDGSMGRERLPPRARKRPEAAPARSPPRCAALSMYSNATSPMAAMRCSTPRAMA